MNNPSIWNPMASAGIVTDAAYLTGVEIPVPADGLMAFVTALADLYILNLTSGAVVDNVRVIGTSLGGDSRWLKTGLADGPAVVFDNASDKLNVRSARSADQSPVDPAKSGITNFGSDTSALTTGVTGNYATCGEIGRAHV
jgi:hypothetical protein